MANVDSRFLQWLAYGLFILRVGNGGLLGMSCEYLFPRHRGWRAKPLTYVASGNWMAGTDTIPQRLGVRHWTLPPIAGRYQRRYERGWERAGASQAGKRSS